MDDLIERLKAATEGTAELDMAIGGVPSWPDGIGPVTPYSRSLDAAVMLVPEGLEWDVSLLRVPDALPGEAIIHIKPFWTSSQYDQDSRVVASAATPALALCIAALMARENEP